jgi:hypothetical protein
MLCTVGAVQPPLTGDGVHQRGVRLVAHDVGVVQHLVFDIDSGLCDLVRGGVDVLTNNHHVLHLFLK